VPVGIYKALSDLHWLTDEQREALAGVGGSLSIFADLSHADVLFFCEGIQPNTATVVAQASPHTVSPIHQELFLGRQIGKKNEPSVFEVLGKRKFVRSFKTVVFRGAPIIQEIYPVAGGDDRVFAVLCVETNALEYERQRKKSPVFRKALARLQKMVVARFDVGLRNLLPMGEHDGLLVVDFSGYIRYISGIAENLYRKLGYTESLLGTHVSLVQNTGAVFTQAVESGRAVQREVEERGLIWVQKSVPLFESETGVFALGSERWNPTGALLVIQDITEQRQKEQALKIKSAMIQEIHHRVKNNLQTIAALLRMEARRTNSSEVVQMVQDSVNRILSIAVVHEFLSRDEDSIINIREVSQQILREVIQGILDPHKNIALRLEGPNLYLPAQRATSCALVINELLQNAVEHGFVGRDVGEVAIRFDDAGDEMVIEITDNGVGLPESFDPATTRQLGLRIIHTLVKEDLRGKLELINGDGLTARMILPK